MPPIRIAIAGIGNCASSLVQGIEFYKTQPNNDANAGLDNRNGGGEPEARAAKRPTGLMHEAIGGYRASDLQVVAAFDIDARKVGKPVNEAIFALPNNTQIFCGVSSESPSPIVQMAPVLDGNPPHMCDYPEHQRFIEATQTPADVTQVLKESQARILVNYLPVGSQKATEHFAQACLDAGVALVNCIPVFIATNPLWADRFVQHGLPLIGDDIKAQVGATITHRTLVRLLADRGVRIDRTYQLNTGGNTDFLNMLNRTRLAQKKQSKTEAVTSQLCETINSDNIHIGPSDFVPWQKDNKVCYLRIEGTGFGGVPMNLEMRLSVEDSPNSAAVVIDAIRLAQLALDRKLAGPIDPACAWCMKHPPQQMTDIEAKAAVEQFSR